MTQPVTPQDLGATTITNESAATASSELPGILVPYLQALHDSSLAEAVRSVSWIYPSLETAHVIGLGLLFGGIFLFDLSLKLWGNS